MSITERPAPGPGDRDVGVAPFVAADRSRLLAQGGADQHEHRGRGAEDCWSRSSFDFTSVVPADSWIVVLLGT